MPVVKAEYVASGTWGNLSWTLDSNGKLVISGNGEMQKASFSAPYPWKEYRDSIISVVINEGVTSISNSAFGGRYAGGEPYACSNLTSVMIPSSMTSIEAYAFWDCSSLTSINIPFGVTSIEEWAFRECSSLTSINIPSSVTNIGECAFSGCTSLTRIDADEANQTYCDLDGVLCNKSGSTIMCYPGGRAGDYNIPPNVTAIDAYAFFGCNNLTGVTIPTSVAKISEAAFEGCISLARVSIPDSVTIIDHFAFMGCSALTNITIPSNVTYIGNQAFQGCGMASITIPSGITFIGIGTFSVCNHLASVIIPSGVTSIMNSAFWRCGELKSVRIPTSVTSIDSSAFAECSALAEIYYEGTEGEWDSISIEEGNNILTSASIHYEAGTSAVDPVIDPGSGISVFESAGDPTITSFRFYQNVDGTDYVDLTNSSDTLTVDYNGSTDPYKFVITVDEPELINHIYVNGDAQDESHQMEATYDSNIGAFVAEGYFDESNIYYQPEDIKLEYSIKSSAPKVGENLNWDEMVPYLNELNNASITVDEEGDTNSGSIDFSGVADGINDMALDYVIKTIDSSTGTKIQELKQEYETAAGVLSYVVPGLDDSKYIVYLDQNDPHTWKMLLSDGLDIAEKAIEIQMTFEDPTSSQYINMVDALDNLGKVSTVANTAYKAYKINKETAELHSEIDRCTTIKEADKDRAHEKAQELHHDKMQFMLLTVTLPILVTTGAVMGPAPAMLFSAIIGAMSATSNVIFDYRVGGILGAEKNAQWYPNLSHTTGIQCGENAYYDYYTYRVNGILLKDIVVYGSGSTYNEYDWDPYLPGYTKNIHVQNGITSLGARFFWGFQGVQTVKLPSSLSEIGWEAFRDCADLTRINIPNGVKTIGSGAFRECTNLGRMDLPDSVECIESGAFSGCESLKVIKLSNNLQTLGAGVFANTDIREITIPNSLKEVVRTLSIISPFEGSNISTIVFEDGIKTIPDYVAFNSENLRQVVIPDSVETIGEGAFNNCSTIENIDLPESLKSIGTRAFAYCASLSSIAIPSSVTSIGEEAFNYSGLTDITVDASNTVYCDINGVLFNKSQTSILQFPAGRSGQYSIPSSVTTIGDYAFCSCSGLTSIIIPFGVTSIGYAAFTGCSGLVSITIPLSVTSIDWFAFSECTGLTNVTIPASLTTISGHMFSDCSSLASVTIPSSVTNVENCAFDGCSGLTSIMIPIAVTKIGQYAFRDCSSLADVYYAGTQQQWNNIVISNDNKPLENADIHFNSFILPTPDFILPAELTVIGNEAFRGSGFTCVKLSDKTTQIGAYAFADCQNLRYIYIFAKTTSIAANAFGNMNNLTIIGESGTTAETYAQNHNYQFVAVP